MLVTNNELINFFLKNIKKEYIFFYFKKNYILSFVSRLSFLNLEIVIYFVDQIYSIKTQT